MMKIVTFLWVLALLIVPNGAIADSSSSLGCDRAESTSSIQKCLRGKLEKAQARLTKAYAAIDKRFETSEQRSALKELQTLWLEYRDQECMWEAEQAKAPGLKGINELSCMARVTGDRADLLEITYLDINPEASREYEQSIRWKNVLRNNHSDVLWDMKQTHMFDLTCNDEPEIVIEGNRFKSVKDIKKNNATLFEREKVIAVIKNPAIGRPDIKFFDFDISNENDQEDQPLKTMCDRDVKVAFEKEAEQNAEDKSCRTKIILAQSKCETKNIIWNEKDFVLEEIEKKEEK